MPLFWSLYRNRARPSDKRKARYDSAGNHIKYGAVNVAYDAENRPRQVTGAERLPITTAAKAAG